MRKTLVWSVFLEYIGKGRCYTNSLLCETAELPEKQ